uniref:Peptidase S1 domain-containing protein n=1 Tax=Stomoxys calcitrans TaxID=35570 RepID=A0A1I8PU36_STOCA
MFVKSLGSVLAALLLVFLPSSTVSAQARIVGGDTIPIASAPYLLQIWKGDEFICGASLIKDNIALTSAGCVSGVKATDIEVVGGADTLSDAGVRSKVLKISRHSSYTEKTPKMDVAVMLLETPLEGDDIATIPLNDVPLKAGQIMQVSGYGQKSEFASKPTGEIRTIFVPILTRANCANYYKSVLNPLPGTMFCASKPGLQDHCVGDRGGPAVSNGKLCGIVSRAVGCARVGFPGLYVGTFAVTSFINEAIANLEA